MNRNLIFQEMMEKLDVGVPKEKDTIKSISQHDRNSEEAKASWSGVQ